MNKKQLESKLAEIEIYYYESGAYLEDITFQEFVEALEEEARQQ